MRIVDTKVSTPYMYSQVSNFMRVYQGGDLKNVSVCKIESLNKWIGLEIWENIKWERGRVGVLGMVLFDFWSKIFETFIRANLVKNISIL